MMCCYYPTTTVAIDDDVDFLRILTQHLEIADCIPYSSPSKAVELLKTENTHNRLQSRITRTPITSNETNTTEDYAFHLNIHKLHEEIYQQNRFQDISVLIIDYHMDGMSGIDVCEALSNHPAKKILLTGSVDKEKIAIEAFNKGIIHRFINKSDPNFPMQLKQAVTLLKDAYFRDLSSIVIPNILNKSLLHEPTYINFSRNLQEQYNAVEYYLLDTIGSKIFLDDNGNPIWLIIKDESEINNYLNIANNQDDDYTIISSLTHRQKIPFFFSEEDYQQPVSEWKNYLYPAYSLTGTNNYYYTTIKGHIKNNLKHDKIVSYKAYQQIKQSTHELQI